MRHYIAALAAAVVVFGLCGCSSPTTPDNRVMSINEFSITPATIYAGASAEMRVNVSNANHVWIDPDIGGVGETQPGVYRHIYNIHPTVTTTYTCHADDGTTIKTKTATITVM
jgi:hypothetical protein